MEMDGLYLLVLFDFQNCLLNGVSILFFYLKSFPEELFSVLRTIQLLRGLTVGMGLRFSCAQQWKPIAEEALLKSGRLKAARSRRPRRSFVRRLFSSDNENQGT